MKKQGYYVIAKTLPETERPHYEESSQSVAPSLVHYDELFATKHTPQPRPPRHDGDGVRVRYFGHACILIESAQTSVLIDPLVSYKYDGGVFRYTYADLPEEIDYVLITHNHQGHCMLETLLQLRHRVGRVLVPRNNGGGLADPPP